MLLKRITLEGGNINYMPFSEASEILRLLGFWKKSGILDLSSQ